MSEFVGVTAPLYDKLMRSKKNILIAGMTGSGKSTILNGIINSILYEDAAQHQLLLVDLKRVEFSKYKNTAHCIGLAKTPAEITVLLDYLRRTITERLDDMEQRGIDEWDGMTIHLIIDEMAELMLHGHEFSDMLQSICQMGRAAGVQVICATQCPLATVIPTRIKVNFAIIIGLHTAKAQHSRNIIDVNGCEDLPMYGQALILYPTTGLERVRIPMIPKEWLQKIIAEDTV